MRISISIPALIDLVLYSRCCCSRFGVVVVGVVVVVVRLVVATLTSFKQTFYRETKVKLAITSRCVLPLLTNNINTYENHTQYLLATRRTTSSTVHSAATW